MYENIENGNNFRFSLYQENLLLCEKSFNADDFNPFTRYSIDIRYLLPQTINRFQRVLSKKEYDVSYYIGNNHYINLYDQCNKNGVSYSPEIKEYNIDNKIIKGVECKIGFYINENPIVERIFYVDGFNPISRFSTDLLYEFLQVTDKIEESIKSSDVNNMWDDYDLINKRGLSINQIRELTPQKRSDFLRRLR